LNASAYQIKSFGVEAFGDFIFQNHYAKAITLFTKIYIVSGTEVEIE
jgi:hypothetical protein